MTMNPELPGLPRKPLAGGVRDDGLRSAHEHALLDAQLLRGGPALRFARYPTSAQPGAHELTAIAVRGDYCEEQGIEVVRRLTGGGALYLDPAQLCWSLVLPVAHSGPARLAEILALHGEAMVAALDRLGVAARFVFPNDVEAGGRKLGSGFAAHHGDRILLQGSLLVDTPEAETMLRILRVPTEKLSHEGVLSARERLTSVSAILGYTPVFGTIRESLQNAFAAAFQLQLDPPTEAPPVGTPSVGAPSVGAPSVGAASSRDPSQRAPETPIPPLTGLS
ncbi:biotin/lipoate A/B protein ligase family protein, partial [Thioalkalivibrio sp.]|uniref:lipoate--protein ligase family protein n=1 Tax=Thioalkalivibrio sp. TaxID=2093813 RepID=UPI00356821FB